MTARKTAHSSPSSQHHYVSLSKCLRTRSSAAPPPKPTAKVDIRNRCPCYPISTHQFSTPFGFARVQIAVSRVPHTTPAINTYNKSRKLLSNIRLRQIKDDDSIRRSFTKEIHSTNLMDLQRKDLHNSYTYPQLTQPISRHLTTACSVFIHQSMNQIPHIAPKIPQIAS